MKRLKSFSTLTLVSLFAFGPSILSAQTAPVFRGRMTLSMSGGRCVKSLAGNAGGDTIKASRGATVQWVVTNNCGADAGVKVGDFIRKGGGGDNPFDASGNDSCSAAPGKSCNITLHVRGNATQTTYSYSVSINGTKQDPDLVIEG